MLLLLLLLSSTVLELLLLLLYFVNNNTHPGERTTDRPRTRAESNGAKYRGTQPKRLATTAAWAGEADSLAVGATPLEYNELIAKRLALYRSTATTTPAVKNSDPSLTPTLP